MIKTLRRVVEDHDTLAGRTFDLVVMGVIVVSLVTFAISTLPDLSQRTRKWLAWIEYGSVAIFTVEYLLRLLVAEKKRSYVFSFFGVIDFLAILPFYLGLAIDLRPLRALRLLRLFRIAKLFRYSSAIRRYHVAFLLAREELKLFFCVAGIVFFLSAVGIYYFEHSAQPETFSSVFDSLWWAVVTLTTVGYGDVYPLTGGGKIFTFFVLLIGLGVVAIPTGLMASALSEARRLEGDRYV